MKQEAQKLNILVLFAGAGLATRGLLNAGHDCTDVEIDPSKSRLSRLLNPEAEHITADVRDLDSAFIQSFDAVWASPPCQGWSEQNHGTADESGMMLLWWSLSLPNKILWVENVISRLHGHDWGLRWNAAQFLDKPVQRRRRMIGGRYRNPYFYRHYKSDYAELRGSSCPAVMASEIGQGGVNSNTDKERRKATKWYMKKYGRMISLSDMAYVQGFHIPARWWQVPQGYTDNQWDVNLSQAIGNGVPVYMAQAFGEAYSKPDKGMRQTWLLDMEAIA